MLAKEPITARDTESSSQLRGRVREEVAAPSNVIALRRGDAGPDELEGRLRDAFDRALADPLAAAKGIAAAVRRDPVTHARPEQMQAVADVLTSTEEQVQDLLEFMVGSLAGGLRIARRRVDLKLLCERVLDVMQREHPEHVIVLACESRVEGEWDPERIASLLSRLVKNAIQHGVLQRVIVEVRGLEDDAVLEVHNQGPAVDDAIVRGFFQPFMRGGAPRRAGGPGLGLGLYLTREIVRAHAGRIDVESDARRTTFRVTLPRS
jgi:signal transduction histidine kinase